MSACTGGGGYLKFKGNSPRWIHIEREKEEDLPVLEIEPQAMTHRLDDASPDSLFVFFLSVPSSPFLCFFLDDGIN